MNERGLAAISTGGHRVGPGSHGLVRRVLVWCSVATMAASCASAEASTISGVASLPTAAGPGAAVTRPNIVLILTDDQRYDSLFSMSNVVRLLGDRGVTFDQAIVSNPLCCPSRATILTGAYSHTTRVWTNVYASWSRYGAWPAFHEAGDEDGTIAVALHDAGYRTALFGKYLNEFPGDQAPPGWDRISAFVNNQGGGYFDYDLFRQDEQGRRSVHYGSAPTDYSTDVLADDAVSFLRSVDADDPLFLYYAPFAPHAAIVPAPRDVGTWEDHRQTLPPSFDEADVSDKPAYIRERGALSEGFARQKYELAYEALQGVDRAVGRIVGALRETDRLRSTLLVFMSDNGIAMGDHRWDYKLTPYEESIHVPLVIRYDPLTSARAGTRTDALVSNVDLAPTFAEVAGVAFDGVGRVDGTSLASLLDGSATRIRSGLLLEHADYPGHYHVPSYCGLRTPGWTYVRYSGGVEELYDLRHDPFELSNLARTRPPVLGRLRERTDRLCRPRPPEFLWG
ncbi:MAG: sulfatase [Actinomycetota bacterium]